MTMIEDGPPFTWDLGMMMERSYVRCGVRGILIMREDIYDGIDDDDEDDDDCDDDEKRDV